MNLILLVVAGPRDLACSIAMSRATCSPISANAGSSAYRREAPCNPGQRWQPAQEAFSEVAATRAGSQSCSGYWPRGFG